MRHDLRRPETAKTKADLDKNDSGLYEAIKRHMELEKQKFPLRTNRQTVIYVAREKCTKEYAKWYLENRMNIRKNERGCV